MSTLPSPHATPKSVSPALFAAAILASACSSFLAAGAHAESVAQTAVSGGADEISIPMRSGVTVRVLERALQSCSQSMMIKVLGTVARSNGVTLGERLDQRERSFSFTDVNASGAFLQAWPRVDVAAVDSRGRPSRANVRMTELLSFGTDPVTGQRVARHEVSELVADLDGQFAAFNAFELPAIRFSTPDNAGAYDANGILDKDRALVRSLSATNASAPSFRLVDSAYGTLDTSEDAAFVRPAAYVECLSDRLER